MSHPAPERGTQLGRFLLQEVIGDGEASQVWRADVVEGPGAGGQAAVKLIRPRLVAKDPDLMEQYVAEAGLARSLVHANVVQVLDVGRSRGQYFVATEFVDGPNLKALSAAARRRGQPMPPEVALEIARQACRGLGAAQKARDPKGLPLYMLHLDVKPANIFIARNGEVKVADFSVMRAKSEMVHTDNIGLLTRAVRYMSPEQAEGREDLDTRSDLFSLCLILYELITGAPMYKGSAPGPLLMAAQQADIDGFADHLPDNEAYPRLVKFFYKGLARNRTHRFADPSAMARGLVAVMKDLPEPDLTGYVEELLPRPKGAEGDGAPPKPTSPPAEPTLEAARAAAPLAPSALPELAETAPIAVERAPAAPTASKDKFLDPELSIGHEMDAWFDAELPAEAREARAPEAAPAPTKAAPEAPKRAAPEAPKKAAAEAPKNAAAEAPKKAAAEAPKKATPEARPPGGVVSSLEWSESEAGEQAEGDEGDGAPAADPSYVIPTPRYRAAELAQRRRFRPASIAAVAAAVLVGGWVLMQASQERDISAPEPVRIDLSQPGAQKAHGGHTSPQKPGEAPPEAEPTPNPEKPQRAPSKDKGKGVVYRAPSKDGRTPAPVGMLTIKADPPASVRVDGELKGRTPTEDLLLPSGKHMVTVKWLTGKTVKASVTLLPGKRVHCIARETPGTVDCD